MNIEAIIKNAIEEDLGGQIDHTSHACFDAGTTGSAELIAKGEGIAAGVQVAEQIFKTVDHTLEVNTLKKDGTEFKSGDILISIKGRIISILTAERLVLNCMQRMCGIATLTSEYVNVAKPFGVTILDTRKTAPLLRPIEKLAVRIGGAENHRFGLFDMILIKDNHVDFAGGIDKAIHRVIDYKRTMELDIPVEIETRNMDEVRMAVDSGSVDRIMLDNFTPEKLTEAVSLIDNKCQTEASGGINLHTLVDYAATGVDFISVGALTHSYKSIDLSLSARVR